MFHDVTPVTCQYPIDRNIGLSLSRAFAGLLLPMDANRLDLKHVEEIRAFFMY